MNILMVHPHDIYSLSEPWTIRITYIAEEFIKKGHKVKLVYFPLPRNKRVGILKKEHKGFETIPLPRNKWSIFLNMIKMYKISKWADIIHFQKCFSIASLPSLFAAYLRNKPVHYDWDDWEYQIYMFSQPSKFYGAYLNKLERIIPKLVDSVSVSSDNIKKLALREGIRKDRIVYAHVGADLKKFNPNIKGNEIKRKYKIKGILIVYIGQLHGGQYAEMLIRASKLIRYKIKNKKIYFMIVGGGCELYKLKEINEKLATNIIFTGPVSYDDIPKYMAATDIAIACFEKNKITISKSPLKIAEYMAAGKAIVASNVGEVKNMVGNAAILTEPGNISSLAKGITRLILNKKLRQELGKKARSRAEKMYNWEVTANNILEAYNLVLNPRRNKS